MSRNLPEPVLAALRPQLQIRAGMLQTGAQRVGWKVATSIPNVETIWALAAGSWAS